jgi:hypothetical protein
VTKVSLVTHILEAPLPCSDRLRDDRTFGFAASMSASRTSGARSMNRRLWPHLVLTASTFVPRIVAPHLLAGETLVGWADRHHYRVDITDEKLAITPAWDSKQADPPLGARKALNLAEPVAKKFLKESNWECRVADWRMEAVVLKHNSRPDRWYWVVRYGMDPKPGHGLTGSPIEFFVAVLMDGSVVTPVRREK